MTSGPEPESAANVCHGGGLILNGDLYTGTAGEIGHHSVDMHGPHCYCGGRGCVELYVAAPALTDRARGSAAVEDSLILSLVDGDPKAINPRVIATAARQGDRVACEIIDHAARALAVGLGNLAMMLVPEMIVPRARWG